MDQPLLVQAQLLEAALRRELDRADGSTALVKRMDGPALLAVATARLDGVLELQMLGDALARRLEVAPRPLPDTVMTLLDGIRDAAARLTEVNDVLMPLLTQTQLLLEAWRVSLQPEPGLYGRSAARIPVDASTPRAVHSRRA